MTGGGSRPDAGSGSTAALRLGRRTALAAAVLGLGALVSWWCFEGSDEYGGLETRQSPARGKAGNDAQQAGRPAAAPDERKN